MSEFTSNFWEWFIIVPTIIGILAMVWLIRWMSYGKKPDPDKPVETMGHVWDDDLEELNNPLPRWWLNLFYITIVFAIIYLILYPGLGSFPGLLGWTSTGQYEQEMERAEDDFGPIFAQFKEQPATKLIDDPDAVRIGQRLFINYCATCHGADARGVPGFPNLRNNDWTWGGDPESIHVTIAQGRAGIMPPWKDILDSDDIFSVAEYVRHLSGRMAAPEIIARGRNVYQQSCAACHGPDGKGNKQLGAPNLANDIWLYGGSQKDVIESIARGREGRMPPHGNFLGDDRIHLLVTYLLHINREED